MNNPIPPHAERLSQLPHLHFVETPSRYAIGEMARREVVDCPSCSHRTVDPPFEATIVCEGCDLKMQITGAWLHIWREAEAVGSGEREGTL